MTILAVRVTAVPFGTGSTRAQGVGERLTFPPCSGATCENGTCSPERRISVRHEEQILSYSPQIGFIPERERQPNPASRAPPTPA